GVAGRRERGEHADLDRRLREGGRRQHGGRGGGEHSSPQGLEHGHCPPEVVVGVTQPASYAGGRGGVKVDQACATRSTSPPSASGNSYVGNAGPSAQRISCPSCGHGSPWSAQRKNAMRTVFSG